MIPDCESVREDGRRNKGRKNRSAYVNFSPVRSSPPFEHASNLTRR
jgi:hypothetical protein